MKITFFGDSICVGQGIALHKGWVSKISAVLAENFPEQELVVCNSSVNGRTTRQALETMPYEIQTNPPNILFIQFGMNDCNCWLTDRGLPRVSPDAFVANLEEIAQRAMIFGVQRIILNTNHITCLNSCSIIDQNFTYQQNNAKYNELIRKVARDYSYVFGTTPFAYLNDIENSFSCFSLNELSTLVLSDLLHLSEKGHDLYFQTTYPLVEKVVKELL